MAREVWEGPPSVLQVRWTRLHPMSFTDHRCFCREGLLYQLKDQAFKDDDMLQEGLAEIVESKTFKVRIVKATKGGATTETVIDDGVVYMQVGIFFQPRSHSALTLPFPPDYC